MLHLLYSSKNLKFKICFNYDEIDVRQSISKIIISEVVSVYKKIKEIKY